MIQTINKTQIGSISGTEDDHLYEIYFWYNKESDIEEYSKILKIGESLVGTERVRINTTWDYTESGESLEPTSESLGLEKAPFVAVFLSPTHPNNTTGSSLDESSLLFVYKKSEISQKKLQKAIDFLDKKETFDKFEDGKELQEATKGLFPDWMPDLGLGLLDAPFQIPLPDFPQLPGYKKYVWAGATVLGALQTINSESTQKKVLFGGLTAYSAYMFFENTKENE